MLGGNIGKILRQQIQNQNTISQVPYFEIDSIKDKVYEVRYVQDSVFEGLEGSLVSVKVGKAERRVLDITGEFEVDEDGELVKESVKVPTGSVVIQSPKNLRIPVDHNFEDGYGYVDYVDGMFEYIIPKTDLWLAPLVGLVFSRSKGNSIFSVEVKLEYYGKVYINVIPFKPGKIMRNTVLIGSRVWGNEYFSREIEDLLTYWYSKGILESFEVIEPSLSEFEMEFKPLVKQNLNEMVEGTSEDEEIEDWSF